MKPYLCVKVADKVLSDLYRPEYESMELVEKLAYAPRVKRWKDSSIMIDFPQFVKWFTISVYR